MKSTAFALVAAVGLLSQAPVSRPPDVNEGMLIEDVTVVSPERPAPLRHASVFIRGGRIVQVGTDIGTIQAGKRADLLLLGANPLESITAYGRIETVILNGRPIPRASLLPGR